MSKLLGSSLVNNKMNVPGPGTYSSEKAKQGDLKFSMAAKIDPLKPVVNVPGPGSYVDQKGSTIEAVKNMKFGSGGRS